VKRPIRYVNLAARLVIDEKLKFTKEAYWTYTAAWYGEVEISCTSNKSAIDIFVSERL